MSTYVTKISRFVPLNLAIIFFAFGVAVPKIDNICFYLLVVLSVIVFFYQPEQDRLLQTQTCKQYLSLVLSMGGIAFSILINQFSTGNFSVRVFDKPSRLALFVCVFAVFLKIPSDQFRHVKWGFIFGTIFCTIQIVELTSDGASRPMANVIEIVTVLSMFSFLSIGWQSKDSSPSLFFQFVAGVFGLYAAYISQTRGVWIAMPIFVLIITYAIFFNQLTKKIVFSAILLAIVLGAILCKTELVKNRINQGKQDVIQFIQKTNLDTSIGTRFQLWQGSWVIFTENPIFGVGMEEGNFSSKFSELAERGIVTPTVSNQPHSHNEILYSLASLGIFGFLGLALTYGTPIYYFSKDIRNPDDQIRVAAAMGVTLCLGFMIFGFVDVLFKYKGATIFYSISTAFFLAQIIKRRNYLLLNSA